MKPILKTFKPPGVKLMKPAMTALFILLSAAALPAQTVTTLAGGRIAPDEPDYGFVDGDSKQQAQFNFPAALAIGFDGRLYVADKNNNAIRRLDLSANKTLTIIRNLNSPVGILFDSSGTMYVLTSGDGYIQRFDTNYNYLGSVNYSGAFNSPTAFTVDGSLNFYVTESGGFLKRVNASNGIPVTIASGFNNPQGVAMLDNGLIAVSDTGNNSIKIVNPNRANVTNLVGSVAGFSNGVASVVMFNSPAGLAKAPNGALVVADRLNHRVRLVQTNGYTTTIYGIDPTLWEDCPNCNPPALAGWSDGKVEGTPLDPAAREPVGVFVTSDGTKIFTTEVYYHIIRQVSGINLAAQGGGGTNGVYVPSPTISPDSGYYPDGITITVSSAVADVFYTTDGSEPTTNSARVQISGNVGTITWIENIKDLSYLKVKAFSGTNSSATVSGKSVDKSYIGIPKDKKAGPGSTLIVPVVATMKPGEQLRSIQFIAQITPNGSAPVISDQFRLMNVTTNDFIQVAAPLLDPAKPAIFESTGLLINNSRSLIITAIGTNSNFEVKSYAVVAMLVVPIPASANIGDSYSIQVTTASGTSDGLAASSTNNVVLTPLSAKTIYITNVAYTVGDTAAAGWYEAGAFGDGKLLNNDVLNVFYASLGIKTPPPFTDLFDAMDAFPDDEPGIPGGDGDIRFMDWQRILFRSLGLLTNSVAGTNWIRYWTAGGARTNDVAPNIQTAYSPIVLHSEINNNFWKRDARVGAISLGNVQPGSVVNVPIYLQTGAGITLYGLQFRASINGPAPLEEPPQFIPAVSAQPFATQIGKAELACVWGGYGFGEKFASGISGSNLLGYIRFKIPAATGAGDRFTVRFFRPDSGDGNRQFNLESFPATVAVLSEVVLPLGQVSDEWRTNFFGSVTNRWSEPDADPDGDGIPNWLEFARGSNPVKLHLLIQRSTIQQGQAMRIKWFGKLGQRYAVEWSDNLNSWSELNSIFGNGDLIQIDLPETMNTFKFFRVKTK